MTIVEDFRRFSIHDLKRLMMLRDGFNGWLNWTSEEETVSSIGLSVRLSGGDPAILLRYTMNRTGEEVAELVKLHFQKSNLPNHPGGHWMFVCPFTGEPCRVLYLDNSHYKSRKALPSGTVYKCQTYTGYFRSIVRIFDYNDALAELTETFLKPYRKEFYRGKQTRIVQRLEKKEERLERAYRGLIAQQL